MVERAISPEITLELTDEEHRALVRLLRRSIEDRFPLAPRHAPIKAILAKLEPPTPKADPLPPLKPALPRVLGEDAGDGEASPDFSKG